MGMPMKKKRKVASLPEGRRLTCPKQSVRSPSTNILGDRATKITFLKGPVFCLAWQIWKRVTLRPDDA
jgi:hypothetical protein